MAALRTDDASLRRAYTALHEGLPPSRALWQPVRAPDGPVRPFGRMIEVQYRKTVPGDRPGKAVRETYYHPFADRAAPRVGVDRAGRLHVERGRYVVTDRGIEDRGPASQQREQLPRLPKALLDLGKLDWIKYDQIRSDGSVVTGVYEFPGDAPTLARDERGDLHVLGGRYDLRASPGPERTTISMRHSNARRMNPRAAEAAKLAMSAAIVGAAAVPATIALRQGFSRIAFLNGMAQPMKALAMMGTGVALAAAIGAIGDGAGWARYAGDAVGVAGMVAGGMQLAQQYAPSVMPAAGAYGYPATAYYPPAGLPAGGTPPTYQAVNPAACFAR